MRDLHYAARTLLIVVILGFFAVHSREIDAAFLRWLGSKGDPLIIQCYAMPKGAR